MATEPLPPGEPTSETSPVAALGVTVTLRLIFWRA